MLRDVGILKGAVRVIGEMEVSPTFYSYLLYGDVTARLRM